MTELQIRVFAFDWLKDQVSIYGDVLPRQILQDGFSLSGDRYRLVGPQGIWKPHGMELPISITSIIDGPYTDKIDENSGILHYRYRGTDPYHRDNVGLRELMKQNIPLIYFYNIAENKYLPIWPVYIVDDNPAILSFTVMADDIAYMIRETKLDAAADNARRAYITANSMIRVHQKGFREKVIRAYRCQCTLCRLKHQELLDAAHIIADKEDMGEPIIQNGLSLCKIHHAAFDRNIIGIDADFQVKIRRDILEEEDGPMLKYGLQSLNNNRLILPRYKTDWPDRERLEVRFREFMRAS